MTACAAAQMLGNVVSPDDGAGAARPAHHGRGSSNRRPRRWLWRNGSHPRGRPRALPDAARIAGHDLWLRDFTGGCGLFSFVFKGGTSASRDRFIDALDLFGIGYSWGGFESLATPVDPARIRKPEAWPLPGLDEGDRFGVRLAVGLEDAGDLIADLTRASRLGPG
jgi:cystathionine beta-lyase